MSLIHLQPDEEVYLTLRKHWFVLLLETFAPQVAAFLGIVVAIVAYVVGFPFFLVAFFCSAWLLFAWMALGTIWTNYFLDAWIVTDRRIIYIEQETLFSRKDTTMRYERGQDVSVVQHGLLATLLNFGTLRITTASASAEDLEIEGIANPGDVRDMILQQIDNYTEHHQHHFKQPDPVPHVTHDV